MTPLYLQVDRIHIAVAISRSVETQLPQYAYAIPREAVKGALAEEAFSMLKASAIKYQHAFCLKSMETNEMADNSMRVTESAELEQLYGAVAKPSLTKVTDHIHPAYRPFIEASPFVALATSGADGLDVSPRGDPAGFIHIQDAKTLLLPDRRGNNRIDSLRNILMDNRVSLLFLIPGIGETLRIRGTAEIRKDPDLLARFSVNNQLPKTVLRITVESVFFQCSRAIIRSKLWDSATHIERQALPSTGSILSMISQSEIDGSAYDAALPERLRTTLY